MPARLAQVCVFKEDGSKVRRFYDVVSGQVEIDNGELLSYFAGRSTIAHHRPVGVLKENDVLVTLEVESPSAVDQIYSSLIGAGLAVDDAPEDTDWGWRVFYFKAAEHLFFEVGAPR